MCEMAKDKVMKTQHNTHNIKMGMLEKNTMKQMYIFIIHICMYFCSLLFDMLMVESGWHTLYDFLFLFCR